MCEPNSYLIRWNGDFTIVTGFWKINRNVTFDDSNVYSQNQEWKLPINLTVIKICKSHLQNWRRNTFCNHLIDDTIIWCNLLTSRLIFQNLITIIACDTCSLCAVVIRNECLAPTKRNEMNEMKWIQLKWMFIST